MLKQILGWGALAGAIVSVPMFGMMVTRQGHPLLEYAMAIGYLIMLIAFTTVFVAIKRRRDHALGGVIRFLPAFGFGLGIVAVATLIYVLGWEATLAATHMDFIGDYARALIAEKQAQGANAAELARFTAEMDATRVQYADPLFRMPLTAAEILPVGLLVALVSAGLLRNPRFLPARPAPAS